MKLRILETRQVICSPTHFKVEILLLTLLIFTTQSLHLIQMEIINICMLALTTKSHKFVLKSHGMLI